MCRIVYIYGLKNGGSDEYRYIGKTIRPKNRLKEHLNEKPRKFSYHKLNWITESINNGKDIEFEIIEEVSEDNWQEKEKYYIDYYKKLGHNLTNLLEGGISPQMINYKLSYNEAKYIVRTLNIKTTLEWRKRSKNKEIPDEIPKRPDLYYLKNGWISWSDWLGLNIISNKNKKFLSFNDSKLIVNGLGIKSNNEWRIFCNSGKKPNEIPSNPDLIYKNCGWVSWADWLGYDKKKLRALPSFLSYKDANNFVSTLGLKTHEDWKNYSKTNRPENIPSNPWKYYKEWNGIRKFLNK